MVTIYIKSKIEMITDKRELLNSKSFFVDSMTCASLMIIDIHLFVHLIMLLGLFVPYPRKTSNYSERIETFVEFFATGFKNKDFT